MKLKSVVNLFPPIILLVYIVLDVTGEVAQAESESFRQHHSRSNKRQVHAHRHHHDTSQIGAYHSTNVLPVPNPSPAPPMEGSFVVPVIPSFPDAAPHMNDVLNGLYPDVRLCYEGIPRSYEKFAMERLKIRTHECFAISPNKTSLCYKECILLHLGYIMSYTVTVMGTDKKLRRYKVNHKTECGHNLFGQDLLGIDTKIWDDNRSLKQRAEMELYLKKVEELGIRNFDPDPFRLKFATTFGEDIVDERLEAQLRICRLFDISVDNSDCAHLNPSDQHLLAELINCVETALTC